uniref:FKBP prolyl isomerase like n=1 Tax=Latimeria chalumnae TaxID=7897 RepID=H3AXW6_LATCH
ASGVWACPDGTFVKKVLERGTGVDKPKGGSKCRVLIDMGLKAGPAPGLSCPLNCWAELTLGEADTEMDEVVEKCLESMLLGEVCEVAVTHSEAGLSFLLHLAEFSPGKESWELDIEEKWSSALRHKDRGTECFKEGNLFGASRRYEHARRLLITVMHEVPHPKAEEYRRVKSALLSNMAACQLRLEQPEAAVCSCSKALALEPGNIKCLYRRGLAYTAISEFDKAQADLRKVLELDPGNSAALQQQKLLQDKIRAQNAQLAKAMSKLFA